jgi:hypothetical protein
MKRQWSNAQGSDEVMQWGSTQSSDEAMQWGSEEAMWQGGSRSKQHNKVASWGSMMRHKAEAIGQGDEVVVRWGNNLMKQHKVEKDKEVEQDKR